MDSFIKWIGGKKLLRKEIINRFPVGSLERYIEVFGGSDDLERLITIKSKKEHPLNGYSFFVIL